MVEPGPLFALEAGEARAIVDVLRGASFDDEHIAATLRSDEITATGERRLAIQRHRTSDGTALHTLIRLLVLGCRSMPTRHEKHWHP